MTAGPPPGGGARGGGAPGRGTPGRLRSLPRRAAAAICGTAAAASAGLAVLVFAAVLVSMAIPRASLGQRTQALRRSLATLSATSTAVLGNLPYGTFGDYFVGHPFTAGQLDATRTELAAGLARQGLPVAAASAWVGLASGFSQVTGYAPQAMSSFPPSMEILYRDRLGPSSRLVTGHLPRHGQVSHGQVVLQIAVTRATAARFGLRPGSRLGFPPDVTLEVTGIVTPADPQSTFWGVDPIAAAPVLNTAPPPSLATYWVGACFIGPAEVPLLQSSVPTGSMQVWWAVPMATARLTAGQVTAVAARLNGALSVGGLVQTNGQPTQVALSSGLAAALGAFSAQDQAIGAVLSLLFVSLAVIGIVAVLLGAGLVAARRSAEFAVMRARGASLRQIAGRTLAASTVLALPAAAAAAVLAIAVTPSSGTPVAWWLAGCVLAAALAGPPLFAVDQHRSVGPDQEGRTRSPGSQQAASRRIVAARRLVAEAGLAAAAIGGIILLRRQGLSPGSVDLYPSAAPVLVAVLAAIVVVHGYPVVLRLLLRLARARPGVSAFVGLAQATRASRSAIVPVFALVLALAVVVFGTMIDDAVYRGDVSESWREVGADALVDAGSSLRPLSPAVQREIAAVPGAERTATVLITSGSLASGARVSVAVVGPSRYAALVARTPGPAFPAADLARRPAQAGSPAVALVPALASPSAAGVLSRPGTSLTVGGQTLRLRLAGRSPGIPGVASGAFLVLPTWVLSGPQPPPTVMLVVGPHLDVGALAATVRRDLPGAQLTFRGAILAGLGSAPLPAAAHAAIAQGAVAAAAFGAVILLIWLLMSAHSRDMTLARLATMGLGRGQARWLVVLETLPLVLAAVVGGAASVYVLAPLIAPSISLSAFTGAGTSAAGAGIRTEPLPLAACAAGLILLSAAALAAQFLITRRRSMARALRVTE